jgi:hypothetical protein
MDEKGPRDIHELFVMLIPAAILIIVLAYWYNHR